MIAFVFFMNYILTDILLFNVSLNSAILHSLLAGIVAVGVMFGTYYAEKKHYL